jgi:hypothetical protein
VATRIGGKRGRGRLGYRGKEEEKVADESRGGKEKRPKEWLRKVGIERKRGKGVAEKHGRGEWRGEEEKRVAEEGRVERKSRGKSSRGRQGWRRE